VDNRFVNCICLEVATFVIGSVAKVILRFSMVVAYSLLHKLSVVFCFCFENFSCNLSQKKANRFVLHLCTRSCNFSLLNSEMNCII